MKILSLAEFKNFCNDLGAKKYIYNTINQSYAENYLGIVSSYNVMHIGFRPNCIYLKRDEQVMYFKGVKYIKVHDESKAPGVIFDIVCGNKANDEWDITHTVIAD